MKAVKQCNFLCRKISTTENKPFIVSIEGNIGKSLLKFWCFCVCVSRKGIWTWFERIRILWLLFPRIPFWGFLQFRGSGFGIRCFFDPWVRIGDPGWKNLEVCEIWDPGSVHFSIFLVQKYLNSLYIHCCRSGSGIWYVKSRSWKNPDLVLTSRIRTSAFCDPKNVGVFSRMLVLSTYKMHRCRYSQTKFFSKFCVTIWFCKHYFSPLNTFMRKRKDPAGPKTCWSPTAVRHRTISSGYAEVNYYSCFIR